jgi:hypothetical protein
MATDAPSQLSCSYCGGPVRVTHHRDGLTFYACVRCTATGAQTDPPEQEFLHRIQKLVTRERKRPPK